MGIRHHARRALLLGTASYLAVALLSPRMAAAEVTTDGTMTVLITGETLPTSTVRVTVAVAPSSSRTVSVTV